MAAFDAERRELAEQLRRALAIENRLSPDQARAFVRALQVSWRVPPNQWYEREADDLLANARRLMHAADMHVRLYREAKRLLIEYEKANQGRYGELGELLSYALAVHYLGAAQIGSKMALKTSQGMPVHGVDGLHVKANADGTVTFFVLESKVMPDATDASRDMVASISDYRADRSKKLNELRLVTDLSNLDALIGEQREAAKSFFNAYQGNGNHLKRRDVHVGSLVFSESAYQNRLPVC